MCSARIAGWTGTGTPVETDLALCRRRRVKFQSGRDGGGDGGGRELGAALGGLRPGDRCAAVY